MSIFYRQTVNSNEKSMIFREVVNNSENDALQSFMVENNDYLIQSTPAYYHTDYIGYGLMGNPDYINVLKNTFGSESKSKLEWAVNQLSEILEKDLLEIKKKIGVKKLTLCVIPRAKALNKYNWKQLLFRELVRMYAKNEGFEDGVDYIVRHTNTRTTHLKNYDHDGPIPYIGITADTCTISSNVAGKDILLIDDIYTRTVNIDEDAIQTLLDNKANSVTFYAVAKTVFRGNQNYRRY